MSDVEKDEKQSVGGSEVEGERSLTLRSLILSLVFGTVFSVGTIYTLVVLSFSMGLIGVVSVILASSASIWGTTLGTKRKAKPLSPQELVGISWLSSAFTQSLGTTILIGGVLLMRYILPSTMFSSWQRWWFAPAESQLGSMVAWLPTILFWTVIVFLARLAVVGIGVKLRKKYIETDELPFPVAEGQADVIKDLTTKSEPPLSTLRYFFTGMVIAFLFSLVFEHNWDYPLMTPLLAVAIGFTALVGGMSGAFPWKVGRKAPRGINKVAYYFSYLFLFIGILGLISCLYAPSDTIFFYLRYGFPISVDPNYVARFFDFSPLIPQLAGLGFGISISILLFVIGYLVPSDSSSGMLVGSLTAFVLIPLAFVGLTGAVNQSLLFSIDSSLVLAALLCATIVGTVVIILRTILTNRQGAKQVILAGVGQLYRLGATRKARSRSKSPQRLSENVWTRYLLTWLPLFVLTLITILVVATDPGAPWYLSIIIIVFAFVVTPIATTLGTWTASRTTRMASQSPLPFLYEATLFSTGMRDLSPYAFGAPVVWQAPGLLSQMRVARLTKTDSRIVYWADLIGFPILGVFFSFLICIWVFSTIGIPSASFIPPGSGGGATVLAQWNLTPIWSVLYTFIVWVAQGGGAFPFNCDPILFFLLPIIILAFWTILHGLRRIPFASTAGIAIGLAILPYMAITIFLGTLTAAIIKKLKGTEWFARYGTTLGVGIYAGASVSLLMIVLLTPLIP
jgi:hypothetical protein